MQENHMQPGEQHPEEWRQDLNPDANAGKNFGNLGDVDAAELTTARNHADLKRMLADFDNDDLDRIFILPTGTRLEQGAVYIDLATPTRQEFKAMANMEVGDANWIVPKKEVDYQMWNRLIGVTNPERTGDADN
jgi:hypothetical protein